MYAARSAKGSYSINDAGRKRIRATAKKLRDDINAEVSATLRRAAGTDSESVRVAI